MRRPILMLLLVLVACDSQNGVRPRSSPTGPAEIEDAAVQLHAEQFDDDLPERPAGSQQEFAAASYITAHLQSAGYVVELDAVPVEDTVRSSSVVALPPNGEPPEVVVVIGYDTTEAVRGFGRGVGIFLELARALRVAVPEHPVEFVALGAEHTQLNGGSLGSRRLISVLKDAEIDPEIVQIAVRTGVSSFQKAGFETNVVFPDDAAVGGRLLDFLIEASR